MSNMHVCFGHSLFSHIALPRTTLHFPRWCKFKLPKSCSSDSLNFLSLSLSLVSFLFLWVLLQMFWRFFQSKNVKKAERVRLQTKARRATRVRLFNFIIICCIHFCSHNRKELFRNEFCKQRQFCAIIRAHALIFVQKK